MVHFVEKLSGAPWLADLSLIVQYDGFQNIRYLNSKDFGRILIINDELQHVEAWAPFYHEIVVHLPCSFIEYPRHALIMGGGSLFAAEELLKYQSIQVIDLVDHDPCVTHATLAAYPERKHILEDRRLNIISGKCENYIQKCKKKYDIVINDCLDLYSFDQAYDGDIYKGLEDIISDEGIVSDLIYRSIYTDDFVRKAFDRINNGLRSAGSILAIPEYPGIFHILSMWGKNANLYQRQRILTNKNQFTMCDRQLFQVFTPHHLSYYLYLPPYLKKYIK